MTDEAAIQTRPAVKDEPPGKPTGCCAPTEQHSCCEPSAKAACCGNAKAGGCGCR